MKVRSLLTVLHNRYRLEPLRYWEDRTAGLLSQIQTLLRSPRRMIPPWLRGGFTQPLRTGLQKMDDIPVLARNNDKFWSYDATKYLPEFKVPDWKTGLRFAFEASPRLCYELNGSELPFGCHAWQKYDRAFWEPFLLSDPPKDSEKLPLGPAREILSSPSDAIK